MIALSLLSTGGFGYAAQSFVAGVNLINPMRATADERNHYIEELSAARVKMVRFGLTAKSEDIEFARNLYAKGVKIDLIVDLQYLASAPTRKWQPEEFPGMWGGHPLSSLSVKLSAKYFRCLLATLDANGIVLAGLELGNEINWAAFNADFPLPDDGRVLSLDELNKRREGRQIARGYRKYIDALAELKRARDNSQVNHRTPIISAGLASPGQAGPRPGARENAVEIDATLKYLQLHGGDKFLDAYGIHVYPPNASNEFLREFESVDINQCRPFKAKIGKPCWITEWGLINDQTTCPIDDNQRALEAQLLMKEFVELNTKGVLQGAIYFAWTNEPQTKSGESVAIFRCGSLTNTGKVVLAN